MQLVCVGLQCKQAIRIKPKDLHHQYHHQPMGQSLATTTTAVVKVQAVVVHSAIIAAAWIAKVMSRVKQSRSPTRRSAASLAMAGREIFHQLQCEPLILPGRAWQHSSSL
mmetsp:Transcript_77425/g.137030  ORF Transcript_77425/g.137030 Transcript_77425/m.137030 type:complete len:110 (-) Transcript_77425:44-373(-)